MSYVLEYRRNPAGRASMVVVSWTRESHLAISTSRPRPGRPSLLHVTICIHALFSFIFKAILKKTALHIRQQPPLWSEEPHHYGQRIYYRTD